MSSEVFSCTECDRTFDALGRFNQHLKTHKKPYICKNCGRGFGLRADLHRHIEARHRVGNPRYGCGIQDCNMKISRKDNIASHMKRYHPEKRRDTAPRNRSRVGAKLNSNDEDSISTALESEPHKVFDWWQSASTGNLYALKSILNGEFDVNSQAQDQNTALHCAARTGQTAIIHFLLEENARLDIENEKLETPLYEAALGGHSECVLLLLRAGGSVRMFESDSWNSSVPGFVDHIVRIGDVQLVQAVLAVEKPQLKKDRTSKAHALAIAAAKIGQIPILQSILKSDPDAAEYRGRKAAPIQHAVSRGQMSAVQILLAPSGHCKDPSNKSSRTISRMHCLIRSAAKRGFLAVLEMLLEYEPNATINWGHLVALAAENGHSEVVRYLLVVGKVDLGLHTDPLNWAAGRGHLNVVEILLSNGAQHNLLCGNGGTAIHSAARNGHLKVVETLLNHGARHNMLNSHLETPLLAAFWNNKLDIVRVLSRYDNSILEPEETCYETTSLVGVAQRLLDKQKLSINSRGYARETWVKYKSLLYLAAEFNDFELAMFVLNHRDWDPQDVNLEHSAVFWHSSTALDTAKRKGHNEMAQLLIEHGASYGTQEQQKQPIPIRVEPDHTIGDKRPEMQEDMDLTFGSDLEEQPYSYIDEYMNLDGDEPSFEAPDKPEEAIQNTQTTWMSTVLG
ncbi:uncharacterized protein EKO05_0000959 [Ascochyta rabiei]|uniref:Metal ion binding n=1 Tax=Didymella rabiei TaxID=5454 RepID=A0A163IC08_DIDRA|nr:uncharacterized protein EKO05_0000959 [Ascochyta rabiei]KZM25694.1 metal ion binding [Ascochyta rabiei]UPX10292.1 hypothetical protein EKO05_0000959 [Ascochyta rabiei]